MLRDAEIPGFWQRVEKLLLECAIFIVIVRA